MSTAREFLDQDDLTSTRISLMRQGLDAFALGARRSRRAAERAELDASFAAPDERVTRAVAVLCFVAAMAAK